MPPARPGGDDHLRLRTVSRNRTETGGGGDPPGRGLGLFFLDPCGVLSYSLEDRRLFSPDLGGGFLGGLSGYT